MRSLDPEGSVVLLGFDRRIAALPACIKARRSFSWFTAAAPAPACRARLQVRRLDWGRTPGLRMGLRDHVGSVVLLGFNRSVAALPARLEARWFTAVAPAGACRVRLQVRDRVFEFPDVAFRLDNTQARPLFLNLPPEGEACSLVHDIPYLDGVVTGFLYFLRQNCVVIRHVGRVRPRLELVQRTDGSSEDPSNRLFNWSSDVFAGVSFDFADAGGIGPKPRNHPVRPFDGVSAAARPL
jgi:hypothetical protein